MNTVIVMLAAVALIFGAAGQQVAYAQAPSDIELELGEGMSLGDAIEVAQALALERSLSETLGLSDDISELLEGGYTHQKTKLRVIPGAIDLNPVANIAADPSDWWKVRTSLDLWDRWQLDVMARHYGALSNRPVPSYTAVDVRLAWQVSPRAEVALVVQNLFDERHIEFNPGAEFRRNGFLRVRLDL